ncbi:EEF1A lysine methyltransferase 2 [Anabrus simplex]|uniref:EEF1A lysine methyltransferase 2 n=1 Tax=Anabrus simplex TaxID=316456 RepID=UPI0035A392DF
MSSDCDTEELGSSELGTKDYWERAYSDELKNYTDHGDVGEIWFGEDSALRIVRWLSSNDRVHLTDRIIDIGCGNGMLLVELAREGFASLTGVDYSPNAIALARAVASSQGLEIHYEVCDVLSGALDGRRYQVALDKGTYDAVSLCPDDTKMKREQYISSVHSLLHPGGLLVITSCNWTEKELVAHFQDKFNVLEVIPTPKFNFGGKSGSLVSSVVFQKNS